MYTTAMIPGKCSRVRDFSGGCPDSRPIQAEVDKSFEHSLAFASNVYDNTRTLTHKGKTKTSDVLNFNAIGGSEIKIVCGRHGFADFVVLCGVGVENPLAGARV